MIKLGKFVSPLQPKVFLEQIPNIMRQRQRVTYSTTLGIRQYLTPIFAGKMAYCYFFFLGYKRFNLMLTVTS